MQDARKGPRMDEDSVGPPHRVAGGPVGYKHGMRGEPWGLGQGLDVTKGKGTLRDRGNRTASTKQQTRGTGKPAAMEWGTVGQSRGTWPREVGKMP